MKEKALAKLSSQLLQTKSWKATQSRLNASFLLQKGAFKIQFTDVLNKSVQQ